MARKTEWLLNNVRIHLEEVSLMMILDKFSDKTQPFNNQTRTKTKDMEFQIVAFTEMLLLCIWMETWI